MAVLGLRQALVALLAAVASLPWFDDDDDPLTTCQIDFNVSTVDDLALCMQRFVIPQGSIPAEEWGEANGFVPTAEQQQDLNELIQKMAKATTASSCAELALPSSLKATYRPPAVFHDAALREDFCLLRERVRGGRFVAGWAWLVLRPAPLQIAVQDQPQNQSGGQPSEPTGWQSRLPWNWSWQRHSQWQRSAWRRREEAPGRQEVAVDRQGNEGGGEGADAGQGAGWVPESAGAWAGVRRLHLEAPHPTFEGPVDLQAASLFRKLPSTARSVVVSGKHRRATAADSPCLPGLGYPASDPSHNSYDALNVISYALLAVETGELGGSCGGAYGTGVVVGGGSSISGAQTAPDDVSYYGGGGGGGKGDGGGGGDFHAAFLQLHGKAPTSCTNSTVFTSAGLGRNAAAFYSRDDTAAARLVAELAAAAEKAERTPAWNVRTPLSDPGCVLTATRNVFGRVVNGVPREEACARSAAPERVPGAAGECFGAFVHAEQAGQAEDPEAWGVWAEALGAVMRGGGEGREGKGDEVVE